MSSIWAWTGVVIQFYIMWLSWKMRRDAIYHASENLESFGAELEKWRCARCSHWYAHPENEGRETNCPFKYHPSESDHCSCWCWREETEC